MTTRPTRMRLPTTGRPLISIAIVSYLSVATTAVAQRQGDPDILPIIETRLPGNGYITRLTDGSLVSIRNVTISSYVYTAIFTAPADNPVRWTDAALQGKYLPSPLDRAPIRSIGGGSDFIYVDVTGADASQRLYSLFAGSEARALTTAPLKPVSRVLSHFASRQVGAIAIDANIHLSIDAGETWNRAYSLGKVNEHRNDVSGLLWLDDARLLVAGKGGSVELLVREGDALRRLWTSKFPHAVIRMIPAGDQVWIHSALNLYRVSLDTGRIDAMIDPRVSFDGAAVYHGRLLLWGDRIEPLAPADSNPGLAVWGRVANDPEYTRLQTIRLQGLLLPLRSSQVVGVAELDAPHCLVFMHSGEAVRLNIETGDIGPIVDLHVERAPGPQFAAPERVRIVVDLAMRLPHEQRMAILHEAAAIAAKEGMTPREQTDWTIERMREAVEALGPAALVPPWEDPSKPTREQIMTLIRLREEWQSAELPMTQWEELLLEANKLELTPRVRSQWQIERIRQALEERRSKPNK